MKQTRLMTLLLAGATALALALPAPASAGHRDAAKIIAGTAALVIIGAAIAEAMDDDRPAYVTRHGHYPPRAYRHPRHGYHHHKYYGREYYGRHHRPYGHKHRHGRHDW